MIAIFFINFFLVWFFPGVLIRPKICFTVMFYELNRFLFITPNGTVEVLLFKMNEIIVDFLMLICGAIFFIHKICFFKKHWTLKNSNFKNYFSRKIFCVTFLFLLLTFVSKYVERCFSSEPMSTNVSLQYDIQNNTQIGVPKLNERELWREKEQKNKEREYNIFMVYIFVAYSFNVLQLFLNETL